jgi:hypothetical protein
MAVPNELIVKVDHFVDLFTCMGLSPQLDEPLQVRNSGVVMTAFRAAMRERTPSRIHAPVLR